MTVSHGWTKSSFSGQESNCVEFRRVEDGVQVRDSKRPDAGVLCYSDSEWQAFLAGVKNGEFDLQ